MSGTEPEKMERPTIEASDRPPVSRDVVMPSNIGDYVFATKYSDGDPADGWAVGFYDGILPKLGGDRYMVVDGDGKQFRGNGFRAISVISAEVGEKMIAAAKTYDWPNWGEPGTVNLWDILRQITDEVERSKA